MLSSFDIATRRAAAILTVLAAVTATTACDDDGTGPSDPVLWEADLTGAVLDGVADVSAQSNGFTATIEIANGTEDDVFTWRIAEGTCAEPGDRIGAEAIYPDLEVAADGTAEAEATVAFALEEDGDYIAAVLDESGAQPAYVACGALSIVD